MVTDRPCDSLDALGRLAAAPFLGRGPQLSAGRSALDGLRSRRGQALLIVGEAGIGKTRLADELVALAEADGILPLQARCHDLEGAPALSPWTQIVRQLLSKLGEDLRYGWLGREGAAWAQLLPELASFRGARPNALARPENDADRHALFDALVGLLRRAAQQTPLLVALDDLHWSDPASVRLARYAVRELRSESIAFVGLYRDTDVEAGDPLAKALADLSREAQVFRLAGLDRVALQQLVEHVAGFAVPDAVLGSLCEQTDGNPFFLVEILRLLASEDRLRILDASRAEPVPLPLTVRHALDRRLDALGSSTREILQHAAVLGREFELEILEAALPEPAPIRPALDEAVHARLVQRVPAAVGRFRFAHDLIRETLEAGLSVEARVRCHRRAGDAIVRCRHARLEEYYAALSHHYLESAIEGGAREAVDFALKGADRAATQFSFELAAALYERALRALELVEAEGMIAGDESARLRAQILLRLGDAAWRSGLRARSTEANATALEIARRIGAPELLAEAAIGLSDRDDLQMEPNPRAVRLLGEALDVQTPADSVLRVRLLSHLVHATGFADHHERLHAWASEACAIAFRLADERARFTALESLHYSLLRPVDLARRLPVVQEMLELARATDSRRFETIASIWQIYDRLQIPDIVGADGALVAFEKAAERLHQPFYRWLAVSLRATRAQMAGRLEEAERLVFRAFELGKRASTPKAWLYFGSQLFQLRREQGRIDELLPIIEKIVGDDPTQTLRAAIPLIHVLCDREDEARRTFERVAARDFEDVPRDLHRLPMMTALATVAAYLGDRRRAEMLRQELLADEGQVVIGGVLTYWEGAVDRHLAQVEESLGLLDEAIHHYDRAAQLALRAGAPLLEAHARVEQSRALHLRDGGGDRARAEEASAIAQRIYRAHGIVGTPAVPTPLALRHDPSGASQRVASSVAPQRGPSLEAHSARPGEPNEEAICAFQRDGHQWSIAYQGRSVVLPESKGLAYLHFLIGNAGEAVHVFDLIAIEAPAASTVRSERRERSGRFAADADSAAPAKLVEAPLERLDDAARRDYRKRLVELALLRREAEADRDLARLEALDVEREQIESELVAAYGLGGRVRDASAPLERARKAVYNRIRDTIRRIGGVHPELGRHLEATVRTGATCIYRPETTLLWRVD